MATPRDEQISESSTPSLFAGVLRDARELALGHLERMRGEIGDELRNLKVLLIKTVIAVGVMVIGAVLAGHFVAISLIALGLAPWAAYGIPAAAGIVAGIVVVKRLPDDKKHADLIPEESLDKLKRDMAEVTHAVRSP